jgi:hypothetical protein
VREPASKVQGQSPLPFGRRRHSTDTRHDPPKRPPFAMRSTPPRIAPLRRQSPLARPAPSGGGRYVPLGLKTGPAVFSAVGEKCARPPGVGRHGLRRSCGMCVMGKTEMCAAARGFTGRHPHGSPEMCAAARGRRGFLSGRTGVDRVNRIAPQLSSCVSQLNSCRRGGRRPVRVRPGTGSPESPCGRARISVRRRTSRTPSPCGRARRTRAAAHLSPGARPRNHRMHNRLCARGTARNPYRNYRR